MNPKKSQNLKEALKRISEGRERTNLLKKQEQKTLAWLVQRIPSWISSDMLTGIGFAGGILVFLSFVLGAFLNRWFLLLGVLGFFISWFGDSLDGRIAYYRKTPRKWYGFSLDLTVDWIGIILMGLGFIFYASGWWKITGFLFVALYGWEMITALLRYKVTGKYSIDSGFLGPTEVRLIISLILVFEVLFKGSIHYLSAIACAVLLITNATDHIKLLRQANKRDREERVETKESYV
ncbi:MAG: CDP-alcohol phosphatidyltransferase [Bacteroidales bacterium]|nr:CDP-alcohol phosphatidyltransferase [Bacteroidales bacterium]